MVDITILIIVPNGLDLWEHIVVLAIALVVLFFYNRKTISAKSELLYTAIEREDDAIDLEKFNKIIAAKMEKIRADEQKKMVSIDTGDFHKND